MKVKISQNVIRRLPRYLRILRQLEDENISRISSAEIGKILGLTASQIRQDFSCFGEFGQQGYGYNVKFLMSEIEKILGMKHALKAILVGCGSIGKSLINNFCFIEHGIELQAGFDISPLLIGTTINGVPIIDVAHMSGYLRAHEIDLAVLTVPQNNAVQVADDLIACGIDAFWNFTNVDIVPPYSPVLVENVHFSDSLLALEYFYSEKRCTICKAKM